MHARLFKDVVIVLLIYVHCIHFITISCYPITLHLMLFYSIPFHYVLSHFILHYGNISIPKIAIDSHLRFTKGTAGVPQMARTSVHVDDYNCLYDWPRGTLGLQNDNDYPL